MEVLELLKGKKMMIETDMKVMVELEIASVKEEVHCRDVGPSNAANDWWPAQERWTTYDVTFTNGSRKTYHSLSEIKVHP